MPNVIFLPQIPSLEYGSGDVGYQQLERYFKVLGTIPAQLRIQASAVTNNECVGELYSAIENMTKVIDDVTSLFLTPVFRTISNLEHEMQYKVREFLKDIDCTLQKLILDILFQILDLIGGIIPNPFTLPIPFLSSVLLIDDSGNPYVYHPVIIDFFTKEGKSRIKASIRESIDDVISFFGLDHFVGDWNVVSFEYAVEEAWQRCQRWLNNLLNTTIIDITNAMVKFLSDIPIIGTAIKALGAVFDPTLSLQQVFDQLYAEAKAEFKRLKEEIPDAADEIIRKLLQTILNLQIPIFGSLGAMIGFDLEDELKRFKVHILEEKLSRIKDAWNDAMEKIRRFFATGWLKAIYDIIDKAGGAILSLVPIVGKIFKLLKQIINILTGQVKTVDVIQILLAPIFTLASTVYNFLPGCIDVVYTEYGLEPDGKTTNPKPADYSSAPSIAYAAVATNT